MAPPKGRKVKNRPTVLDGEPVLTFHEGKMRKGECIRGDVEGKFVKYLVRFSTRSRAISTPLKMAMAQPFSPSGWSPPEPQPGPAPSDPTSPISRFNLLHSCSRLSIAVPLKALSGSESGSGSSTWSMTVEMGEDNPSTSSCSMFSAGFRCPKAPEWEYEWVPEGRVLRYTTIHRQKDSDAALQRAARELLQGECSSVSSEVPAPQGEGSSSAAPEMQVSGKRKHKRGLWQGRGRWGGKRAPGEPEHMCLAKLEIHIQLPKPLKALLLQDWELVTMTKKLFILPAKKTVNTILSDYVASQQNCTTAFKTYAIGELVLALQEFFDMMLGTQLLYQFEKLQHQEIQARHPHTSMSHIYGGAHLLRLFLQLESMLGCLPLGGGSLHMLLSHLENFLKYFASNPSLLFKATTDYRRSSAKYKQKAG